MEPIEYLENPGKRRRKSRRSTPPRGKGGRFRKRKTGRRRRRNPAAAAAPRRRNAAPAPRRRRRSNPTRQVARRRSNPRGRGAIERATNTLVQMGTLAIGGYVGTGLAKFIVQKVDFVGDMLANLNLSEKQQAGVVQIGFGVLADPLLRMAGMPARFRTPIRNGVILFGIKDLLDDFVQEQVYDRMGLTDYLTVAPGARNTGVGNYLRAVVSPQQIGAPPVTSYGMQIPTASYDGNPFAA